MYVHCQQKWLEGKGYFEAFLWIRFPYLNLHLSEIHVKETNKLKSRTMPLNIHFSPKQKQKQRTIPSQNSAIKDPLHEFMQLTKILSLKPFPPSLRFTPFFHSTSSLSIPIPIPMLLLSSQLIPSI
ncbi:hypothetical protein RIF29_13404 [Crotalaria pallida]|uniref:Uncharacterized protein n=1 Tax=Crotalaria pallida TaxID=3830 RepID=A0AAN9IP62_CROPI